MAFNSILIGSEDPRRLVDYRTRLLGEPAMSDGGYTVRMRAAGAVVIQKPYNFDEQPEAWIATLADPDDDYFQLMSPMGPPEG